MNPQLQKFLKEAEEEFAKDHCEICVNWDDPENCKEHELSQEDLEIWRWVEEKLISAYQAGIEAVEVPKQITIEEANKIDIKSDDYLLGFKNCRAEIQKSKAELLKSINL